ncbi:PREDICTED: tumor necrosis factor receptor superfamily member 5-like [Cyprinodon variegatus]|uniref:tumor necrosis factor receptor superfamily member 5-like n=1 Tax=Cyprinodon variegatus TaxID=28743 RepID=UPI0007427C6F|nr:PREDICTED: tumor necrosis factor receptor superfamily member 5-like [Cyprinodon variegatus]
MAIILMRATRVHTSTCHLTEYRIGNECCALCPPGSRVKTDCTEFIRTTCQPCSAGTYFDEPNGLKRCSPCSTCDSGAGLKVKEECRRSADTVCEPMEGFFCTDLKPGGCGSAQRHRSCKPGQFIRRIGTASTDTDCSDCVAGTFSDGSMSSCQPHTQCEKQNLQLIKAGNTSTDAECGEKKKITGIVIGVVMGFLLLATIVAVVIFLWKYQRKRLLGVGQSKTAFILSSDGLTCPPSSTNPKKVTEGW